MLVIVDVALEAALSFHPGLRGAGRKEEEEAPPSGSQKAAPSGQVRSPLCLILRLPRLPFLTGISPVFSTSWQVVSAAGP